MRHPIQALIAEFLDLLTQGLGTQEADEAALGRILDELALRRQVMAEEKP